MGIKPILGESQSPMRSAPKHHWCHTRESNSENLVSKTSMYANSISVARLNLAFAEGIEPSSSGLKDQHPKPLDDANNWWTERVTLPNRTGCRPDVLPSVSALIIWYLYLGSNQGLNA